MRKMNRGQYYVCISKRLSSTKLKFEMKCGVVLLGIAKDNTQSTITRHRYIASSSTTVEASSGHGARDYRRSIVLKWVLCQEVMCGCD
eukprot:scaffold44897_cov71-Attheya_sp.AAC.1